MVNVLLTARVSSGIVSCPFIHAYGMYEGNAHFETLNQ